METEQNGNRTKQHSTFIHVNKENIQQNSIQSFLNDGIKQENEKNNKIRETIVCGLINKKIPSYWLELPEWRNLNDLINSWIDCYYIENNINKQNIKSVTCKPKGGRKFNYDFEITIQYKINGTNSLVLNKRIYTEFKFNASCVKQCPQFASPMKPSQYMTNNYEEGFYEKYLPKIINKYNELYKQQKEVPSKGEYLKTVHEPYPTWAKDIQMKYYGGSSKKSSQYTGNLNDIEFCKFCKQISKESIILFIKNENTELDISKLTQYLYKSQKNKRYMLYKNGNIYTEKANLENYNIVSFVKDSRYSRFLATTKNGIKIKILLRWKNGNGIAFPAFQIS